MYTLSNSNVELVHLSCTPPPFSTLTKSCHSAANLSPNSIIWWKMKQKISSFFSKYPIRNAWRPIEFVWVEKSSNTRAIPNKSTRRVVRSTRDNILCERERKKFLRLTKKNYTLKCAKVTGLRTLYRTEYILFVYTFLYWLQFN